MIVVHKLLKMGILLIFTVIAPLSEADAEADFVDDMEQVDPLISLRSIETGVPLKNGQYNDDRNLQWIIREVLASDTILKQAGMTQFKVPGLNRCLYTIQNRLISASCDAKDTGSLWKIIPTELGAVEIKSMRTNTCLSAGKSHSDYRLAPCQENEAVRTSPKLLWFFAPAVMPAKLSPAFPVAEIEVSPQ
ncbi:hypothetical protein ACLS0F_06395 [Avibacterium endocarditidis]|uniref:Ricin B lectin domain-containing protein n=1 Tax=Avibacterium endocarditidis TaxID=380674 RepID=A0ABX4ZTB3_9PAST|nr:hypothetical protein [Avibacterium endocarditidis]POY42460.1 hypothetical protein C3Z13_05245 [Avibacterium endocarditidis]